MDFINWLLAHSLCLAGFLFLYGIACKTRKNLKNKTKKVSSGILFLAIVFYVWGYVTPISPFSTILLAYVSVLSCIVMGKIHRLRK